MKAILRAEGLTKTFEVGVRRRRVEAVKNLSFSVEEGEIFGFVGPNGAGKTTTIKMLMGLIQPTAGRAWIFDAPIPTTSAKARLGYLPEHPAYYEFLTGAEALRMFATLAEVPSHDQGRRCTELLELVGLSDAADRQIRKYSKGMQQRLGIAQALVNDPVFVVLDEPMSGLDPVGRKEMRDIIVELKRRGKTVFFSTHILPDVEVLCDRVGLILNGTLRDVGRLGDLLSPQIQSVEVTATLPPGWGDRGLGGQVLAREGERVTVVFPGEGEANAAVAELVRHGGSIVALNANRETLEHFLLRRLGERSRPDAERAGRSTPSD